MILTNAITSLLKRFYIFPSVLFCREDEKDINSLLEAAAVVAENINVSFGEQRARERDKENKSIFFLLSFLILITIMLFLDAFELKFHKPFLYIPMDFIMFIFLSSKSSTCNSCFKNQQFYPMSHKLSNSSIKSKSIHPNVQSFYNLIRSYLHSLNLFGKCSLRGNYI